MPQDTSAGHVADMPLLYKVTDRNAHTMNSTRWGPQVSHDVRDRPYVPGFNPKKLYIWAYRSPTLAALFAPVHFAMSSGYRLWLARGDVKGITPTSAQCALLTTIEETSLPRLTLAERLSFCLLAARSVFENEAWRVWAACLLIRGGCSEHQVTSAKSAAESAGMAAEQRAENAQSQFVSLTNMYRSESLRGEMSAICNMPPDMWTDAHSKMEAVKQTAEAESAAAQAACWATNAVMLSVKAGERNTARAELLLGGEEEWPSSRWWSTALSHMSGHAFAVKLAMAVNETLSWVELAAEMKPHAAGTRAVVEARERWTTIADKEERTAFRDSLRKEAIAGKTVDFQSIVESMHDNA